MFRTGYVSVFVLSAALMQAEPFWYAQAPTPPPAPEPTRAVVLGRTGSSYLGVGVAEVTSTRAKALNLKEEYGVEITRVEDDSPAAKAGLKTGDVVVEYNGQRVEGVEQFMRLVRETPSGREVKLTVSRGGSIQTLPARVATRKLAMPRISTVEVPSIEFRGMDLPRAHMSLRSSALGIDAEGLDAQLAEFFGVKEGVLIRSVMKGSAGERAGLKAGDVIVKVDDSKVTTPREITSGLRSKKTVSLGIVREKREIAVSVTLDAEEKQYQPMRAFSFQ
jgi:serine protease Do